LRSSSILGGLNTLNVSSHAGVQYQLQREYSDYLGRRDVIVIPCQARSFTRKFAWMLRGQRVGCNVVPLPTFLSRLQSSWVDAIAPA